MLIENYNFFILIAQYQICNTNCSIYIHFDLDKKIITIKTIQDRNRALDIRRASITSGLG